MGCARIKIFEDNLEKFSYRPGCSELTSGVSFRQGRRRGQFPSWEGLGVGLSPRGSWKACIRLFARIGTMNLIGLLAQVGNPLHEPGGKNNAARRLG